MCKKSLQYLWICGAMVCMLAGCGAEGNSTDLMRGVRAEKVEAEASEAENRHSAEQEREDVAEAEKIKLAGANATSVTDFAVRLFQQSLEEDKNTLISPLSVISALGMTANGAKEETLAQMEQTFGIGVSDLNEYLHEYMEQLPEDKNRYKLSMANAIWFRDTESLTVEKEFLQTNANFYDAAVKKAPFDNSTLKEINAWVSDNTDGMIDNILDRIPDSAVMYLVNALAFDAEWQEIYYEHQVRDGEFTKEDGTKQEVQLMYSMERGYMEDDNAEGFIKYYADGKYAFVALLPKEGISVSAYADSLKGEELHTMLTNLSDRKVRAAIPKFESEYSLVMNDVLMDMGMKNAFDVDRADFSALGSSDNGNLYISQVRHKTFIAVDERGTKAGAATIVEMADGAAMEMEEPAVIYLDRPFVYMIVDCEEWVPVFIGVVHSVE